MLESSLPVQNAMKQQSLNSFFAAKASKKQDAPVNDAPAGGGKAAKENAQAPAKRLAAQVVHSGNCIREPWRGQPIAELHYRRMRVLQERQGWPSNA